MHVLVRSLADATPVANAELRLIARNNEVLATIRVDANITNAAFGGPARRTLFLTGAASLWSIELPVAGLPY